MLTVMILAPLLGALLLTVAGRRLGERLAGALACLAVAVAAGLAFAAFSEVAASGAGCRRRTPGDGTPRDVVQRGQSDR